MIFMGIDLGASSLKAVLIDTHGAVLAQARAAIPTQHPATGHAEQAPQDWLAALGTALTKLHAQTRYQDIAAISVTGGAHIAVPCDTENTALAPAIMWSDQRAATEAAALPKELCLAHSLNAPNPTWTLPQLIWRRSHTPDIMTRMHRLVFAKDWLRDQLMAAPACVTDAGEAVGGLLFDAARGTWSDQLCALAGLDSAQLPRIVAPDTQIGVTGGVFARAHGLPDGVPIIQGSIDTSVELACCGSDALTPDGNIAIVKLATAGVVSYVTATADPKPPVSLYPTLAPEQYYHASGMSHCAAALDWLATHFFGGADMDALAARALTVPAASEGVLFHPYLNGERAPHWSSNLRARLSGMTRASSAAHIARAGFEGVSFALHDILSHMAPMQTGRISALQAIGGGAQSPFWMQILADITGLEIHVPRQGSAAYGAARIAAATMGYALPAPDTKAQHYDPDPSLKHVYDAAFASYDAIRAKMMQP